MDEAHYATVKAIEEGVDYLELDYIANAIDYIRQANESDREQSIQLALSLLNPFSNMTVTDKALTESELTQLQQYPNFSAALLEQTPFWQDAALIVKQFHECVSDNGYPLGLKEQDICLGAKILGIAQAFEAIISNRNYRKDTPHSIVSAVMEISKCSGKKYDPRLINVFGEVVRALYNEKFD